MSFSYCAGDNCNLPVFLYTNNSQERKASISEILTTRSTAVCSFSLHMLAETVQSASF